MNFPWHFVILITIVGAVASIVIVDIYLRISPSDSLLGIIIIGIIFGIIYTCCVYLFVSWWVGTADARKYYLESTRSIVCIKNK